MHNNNNIKHHDIQLIEWAFEKGYFLGQADGKDGVHINFNEVKKYFLAELAAFYSQQKQSYTYTYTKTNTNTNTNTNVNAVNA